MTHTYKTFRELLLGVCKSSALYGSAQWHYSGSTYDFGIKDTFGNYHVIPFRLLKAEMHGLPKDDLYRVCGSTMVGGDKSLLVCMLPYREHSLVSCHA